MASQYKVIDGVKYDRALLEEADACVAGVGDGRISKADALKLLESAKDGDQYTDIEHATMGYIKDHYKWTAGAKEALDEALSAWLAEVDAVVVGDRVLVKGLISLADSLVAGVGDGRISKADAEQILEAVKGGRMTARRQATVAHLLEAYKWTAGAEAWFREAAEAL